MITLLVADLTACPRPRVMTDVTAMNVATSPTGEAVQVGTLVVHRGRHPLVEMATTTRTVDDEVDTPTVGGPTRRTVSDAV